MMSFREFPYFWILISKPARLRIIKAIEWIILSAFVLITVNGLAQKKDVRLSINLISCFDQSPLDMMYVVLESATDTIIGFDEPIMIYANTEYLLTIHSYQGLLTKKIVTNNNREFDVKVCIGDSIPFDQLMTNEKIALEDIEKGDMKIFTYGDLRDSFVRVAWRYGCPYSILNRIAKEYHFSFVSTGCVLNESRRQAYSRYNNQIIDYLNTKEDKNWINELERKIVNELIKENPTNMRGKYRRNPKRLILNPKY